MPVEKRGFAMEAIKATNEPDAIDETPVTETNAISEIDTATGAVAMDRTDAHSGQGSRAEDNSPSGTYGNAMEQRLSEATKAVISSVDAMMAVTHDLVTTEEGRRYIEKAARDAQVQVRKSLDEIVGHVRDEMDRKRKTVL